MSEQETPQTPVAPETAPVRPPRRGPNWGLIVVLFGVSLAFFAIGIANASAPLFGSTQLRWQTTNAISTVKEWDTVPGTRLYGEPELVELEDGTLQIVATFGGEEQIQQADLTFTCSNLPIPRNWTQINCAIDPTNSKAYFVVLQRE